MPYIGRGLTSGAQYQKLDTITIDDATTFTMQVNSTAVTPPQEHVILAVNGVLQEPGVGFTVTGSTCTLASAIDNDGGTDTIWGVVAGAAAFNNGIFGNAVTVGVDDTGYDVKFFGATSGDFLLWDESADQLVLSGTMKIKEQADADSDTAAYGQLWVNTATPNELYFTTDAGNDIAITSGTAIAAAATIDDLSDAVSGITNFTNSLILGHQTTGTLSSADQNTAVGYAAMDAITSGDDNTIMGYNAGSAITSASDNVILGSGAGVTTTDVDGAVIIGQGAGAANMTSTADGAVLIGYQAGAAITTGANNIAIGKQAMLNHGTGGPNIAIGSFAMDDTDAGSSSLASEYNIFIGANAGGGTWADANSSQNTAIGHGAMDAAMNAANSNTAVGYAAGTGITTGDNNTMIGHQAGNDMTTGENNVFVGRLAGNSPTDCDNAVCIGYNVSLSGNPNGAVAIGGNFNGADQPNEVTFGNGANTMKYDLDAGNITITSDERVKENIVGSSLGLTFIDKLRPVQFNKKAPADLPEEFWNLSNLEEDDPARTSEESGTQVQNGLIAQEVKAIMDELDIEFTGWREESETTKQELSYVSFVVPLIKAVQELSAKVVALESG